MNYNLISSAIPAKVLGDAEKAIESAMEIMKPYLLTEVNVNTLNAMAKMGDRSEQFVKNALEFAATDEALIPKHCNLEEARKDYEFFLALKTLSLALTQFNSMVSQNRVIAGAEALDFANDYYKNIKQMHLNNKANVAPIYDDLKGRYERNPKRPSKPAE